MQDTRPTHRPHSVNQATQASSAGYTTFANSKLWELQRQYFAQKGLDAWADGEVPLYVTSNPCMAKAYAQVVLGFWRDLKAQGKAVSQPLYIIELGAGAGRFAYHFLQQFFPAFDAIRDPGDKVCYVMTEFSTNTVSQWRQRLRSKLHPYVVQGRLDFAVFDGETDGQLELQHQQICLTSNSLELPPVVIANSVFDGLRQDLFFLDKDQLYEGWVQFETNEKNIPDQPFAGLKLTYQKRRILAPQYPNHHWNQLIESYAKRLPPCALVFPSYTLNTMERLSQLHRGNLLLLSADRASLELKELSSQQKPDLAYHNNFSVSVNYHSLIHLIEAQGGRCWTGPISDGLAILAACWRSTYIGETEETTVAWRETAYAAQQALQGFNPNDFYRIKQALETEAQYLSPEQMLAFLRLSQWDTKVFYLMYPYIYDFLAQLPAPAQQEWYRALNEVWRFHMPIGEDYDLAFDLGSLAAELNRWSAARDWFLQSLEHLNPAQHQAQNLCSIYFNLGIAHWQLAAYSKAESYLLDALNLELATPAATYWSKGQASIGEADESSTENSETESSVHENDENEDDIDDEGSDSSKLPPHRVRQQLADLQLWQAKCQKLLGAQTLHLPATTHDNHKALFASLLGPHQAQALYRLQRDPELCQLARVECLQSTRHAQEWLELEQSEYKHILAIFHPDFGLVGVAALECPSRALDPAGSRSARFYYWIGRDYQHHGFGVQAMQLLHQLAHIKGVQHLFSEVDQNNMASQRALAKLGYQRLDFKVIGEPPGYRYHHFGSAFSKLALYNTLNKLLDELGNSASLAPFPSQELA